MKHRLQEPHMTKNTYFTKIENTRNNKIVNTQQAATKTPGEERKSDV